MLKAVEAPAGGQQQLGMCPEFAPPQEADGDEAAIEQGAMEHVVARQREGHPEVVLRDSPKGKIIHKVNARCSVCCGLEAVVCVAFKQKFASAVA